MPLSALLALLACTPSATPAPPWPHLTSGVAVATGVSMDYAVGNLFAVDRGDLTLYDGLTATSGDPVVRVDGGLVLQLNRYGYDSIRLYEPGFFERPVLEFSTDDGGTLPTNPVDARVCGDKLFVALYGRDQLPWYSLDFGRIMGRATLADLADGDGVGPEPGSLAELDGTLLVGLNRLDRGEGWTDRGGAVVALDCADGARLGQWEPGGNAAVWEGGPTGALVSARPFEDKEGGLFLFDGALTPCWQPPQGEEITGVAADAHRAVVTTLAADLVHARARCVDLDTGASELLLETTSLLSELRLDPEGRVWLSAGWGTQGETPALRLIDLTTCSTTEEIIPLLAPFSVDFY